MTRSSLNKILLLFVMIYCSSPSIASSKDESQDHFGFRFLSTYDSSLSQIKKQFGSKTITDKGHSKRPGRLTKELVIRFDAPFFVLPSNNALYFTPLSKRLYEIGHTLMKRDSDDSNFHTHIEGMYALLTKKYGRPRRIATDDPNLIKHWIVDHPNFKKNWILDEWITRKLRIWMTRFRDNRFKTVLVYISYTDREAEKLEIEEQVAIISESASDLE